MARHGDGFDGADVIDIGRKAGGFARRHLGWIALVALALIFAFTGYFQVEPDEVGVVTRFGRYTRTAQPGPHFKIPFGIEKVKKVPVQRQLKQEFGFRTADSGGGRTEYATPEEAAAEALMLTGDLNVATVEWIVQYKIRDPYKYLFKVRNVETTFRDMSEAAMRQVVGDRSVTEVLSIGREDVQEEAKKVLQALADEYDTGIEVLQLVLQNVNPPEPVRDSFNEVSRANQEKERLINEANAEYNRIIPEARGKAQREIQSAEGYRAERVNRARGDVARFLELQKEYAKASRVTRTRIYLETMAEVLPKAKERILLDGNLKGLMPLLGLGKGATP